MDRPPAAATLADAVPPAPSGRATGTSVAAEDAAGLDRNIREMHRGLVVLNVAVLALMVTLAAVALRISLDSYHERGHDASTNLAASLQQSVGAAIERSDMTLQTVLQLARRTDDPARIAELIDEQQALVPAIDMIGMTDADGVLQVVRPLAGTRTGLPLADREFFQRAQAETGSRLVIAGPVRLPPSGRWALVLARRLERPDGSLRGVVFAHLPSTHFDRLFGGVKIGLNGAVSLRTLDRRLVARRTGLHTTESGLGSDQISPQLAAALVEDPNRGSFVSTTALDGVERINAYQRVGDFPLIVNVGLARSDYLQPWRSEAAVVVSLAALVVLALAGSSVLVDRSWRRSTASTLALMRERDHHRALLHTATDGIHVLDGELRVVELSDSFAALVGRSRESLLGTRPVEWDLDHGSDRQRTIPEALRREGRFDLETRYRRPDGTVVHVQVIGATVRIDGRELLYCSARDVTARKRAEVELRSSREFLDRTGRIARVGGWVWHMTHGSGVWSEQTFRILDMVPGPVPSAAEFYARCDPEGGRRLEAAMQQCMCDGTPWDHEVAFTTVAERQIWIRSVGEADFEAGRPVRIIGAIQDVTELRSRRLELEREQALRAATERHAAELDALLRERSEMLDVMAHEVRQPLNNASAALQGAMAALDTTVEPQAARPLLRAQVVLAQVVSSLDNTLAVATLLARPDPIERQDTDIDTLVAVTLADIPPEERARVRVARVTRTRTASLDMGLMRLALRNVIANALKYSPPTSPVMLRIADSDDPLALLIDVIDSGDGIEPEMVGQLGRRGVRGKRARGKPGLGLGLHIVQRVMSLHGGSVQLLNTAPRGATMRLVIPPQ